MKTEKKTSELVRAAQRAGAEDNDFWREVEDHLKAKHTARMALVKPRALTDAPKLPTV
jgi:hypothetical protein